MWSSTARLPAASNLISARLVLVRPDLLFVAVVGLHVLAWTLLPVLVHPNAPLDVVEGMAWGREWQPGYAKGPPLFAWTLGVLDPLPGDLRLAAIYLVSQLCIAVTFFGVWRLGCRILSSAEALLGVMLLEGVYYLTYPTPELNEIIMQMPISALLGWVFHRAVTEARHSDWVVVGVLAALGMWTRYSSAAVLLSLGAFVLMLPAGRRCVRTAGPYIAFAVFLLLWSPHVAWIVQSDFQSIAYVASRAVPLASAWDYLIAPANFGLAQLLALLPALALAFMLHTTRRSRVGGRDRDVCYTDRVYVAVLALGPFVIAEALSLATGMGLRSMWGGPLWCFIGLFLVVMAQPTRSLIRLRPFLIAWCIVAALPVVAYAGVHGLGPVLKANEKRSSFPGDALADAVTAVWRDATGQPLRFVVGETWLAGNVAFYSPDRPSVFIDADRKVAPWIDPDVLVTAGAVLLWDAAAVGDALPAELRQAFPSAVVREPLVLSKRYPAAQRRVRIGWAIMSPTFAVHDW